MKDSLEWSNAFDILWNNISSDRAAGLSEYEKSIFLTKAQNELVKNYFDAVSKGNTMGKGFDDSAIRQLDFSSLLSCVKEKPLEDTPTLDYRALVYGLPDNMLAILNEEVDLEDTQENGYTILGVRQVIPLHYREYTRLMSRPYKEPLKWQAWRLITDGGAATKVEVVLSTNDKKYPTKEYVLRYVRKPVPIILEDLSKYDENLKIDGMSGPSLCELHENMHDAIVQRAVEIAKVAWEGNNDQTQLQTVIGQRSE